jgi:hypothetical protein
MPHTHLEDAIALVLRPNTFIPEFYGVKTEYYTASIPMYIRKATRIFGTARAILTCNGVMRHHTLPGSSPTEKNSSLETLCSCWVTDMVATTPLLDGTCLAGDRTILHLYITHHNDLLLLHHLQLWTSVMSSSKTLLSTATLTHQHKIQTLKGDIY